MHSCSRNKTLVTGRRKKQKSENVVGGIGRARFWERLWAWHVLF